jgi:hypothetical protein
VFHLAIEFKDDVDATGVATLLLALVTVALAVATIKLATWTKQAVANEAVAVERSHRPVLVPKIDRTHTFWSAYADSNPPLEPHLLGNGTFYLPVRNVGMGPALDVVAEVTFGDQYGNPSAHGIASGAQARATGISHDEPWFVIEFAQVPVTDDIGFQVALTYRDVAGKGWITTGRYNHTENRFEDVVVAES